MVPCPGKLRVWRMRNRNEVSLHCIAAFSSTAGLSRQTTFILTRDVLVCIRIPKNIIRKGDGHRRVRHKSLPGCLMHMPSPYVSSGIVTTAVRVGICRYNIIVKHTILINDPSPTPAKVNGHRTACLPVCCAALVTSQEMIIAVDDVSLSSTQAHDHGSSCDGHSLVQSVQ